MPTGFRQMLRFEKMNNCKINVFRRYLDKKLVSLRNSREYERDLETDLLLIDDVQEYHYVLINELLRVVSRIESLFNWGRVLCVETVFACAWPKKLTSAINLAVYSFNQH